MALSQGNSQGWYDVAQPQTPAPLAAPSHLEAREGPAPAQWQAVKEEIRTLYEKKPLKDVRKILEQRRGFRATYVQSQSLMQASESTAQSWLENGFFNYIDHPAALASDLLLIKT